MENPFRIKPGEILALDQAMDRLFNWTEWNRENYRSSAQPGCNTELYSSFLCCTDHMAISSERDAFFSYLFHLTHDMSIIDRRGFSMHAMKQFIKNHGIATNPRKAANYHFETVERWQRYMLELE